MNNKLEKIGVVIAAAIMCVMFPLTSIQFYASMLNADGLAGWMSMMDATFWTQIAAMFGMFVSSFAVLGYAKKYGLVAGMLLMAGASLMGYAAMLGLSV